VLIPVARAALGHFSATVNGVTVKFSEAMPKGEHVLDRADLKRASDYVLIQLLTHCSRSVGLDETVDLRAEGTEVFCGHTWVFSSSMRWLRSSLPNLREDTAAASDLPTIEEVAAPTARDKIKGRLPKKGNVVLEAVLHSDGGSGANSVVTQFKHYLGEIGIDQPLDRRFAAGGLCFVELEAPVELADRIATFTPVRALRQMPTLRILRPSFRSSRVPMEAIQLPDTGPIDPKIRVAIFDGDFRKGIRSASG
jgi:hypothetical protein